MIKARWIDDILSIYRFSSSIFLKTYYNNEGWQYYEGNEQRLSFEKVQLVSITLTRTKKKKMSIEWSKYKKKQIQKKISEVKYDEFSRDEHRNI